jgi:spermidine synthase
LWNIAGDLFYKTGKYIYVNYNTPYFSEIFSLFIYAFIVQFIPSLLLGIIFPMGIHIYSTNFHKMGQQIGSGYLLNTLGAVLGSLLCYFIFIPLIGVQNSLILITSISAIAGFYLLTRNHFMKPITKFSVIGLLLIAGIISLFEMQPNTLKHMVRRKKDHQEMVFYKEGMTGTVSVFKDKISNVKKLFINKISEVPTEYISMQTFKLLGHLPLLLSDDAKDVLMVTFGGGISSGAVIRHDIASLDVVDIEETVIEAGEFFREENNDVLNDSRVNIHIEDGRHFLALSEKRYDVIISDSTHPKTADSWLLYTKEFYDLCKKNLKTQGIMAQWVPIHSISPEIYKIILKTFSQVFPHTNLWYIKGYTIMVATPDELHIDFNQFRQRVMATHVNADLLPWDLNTVYDILDTFLLDEYSIKEYTKNAPVNTDNMAFTQFLKQDLYVFENMAIDFMKYKSSITKYLTINHKEEQRVLATLKKYTLARDYLVMDRVMEAANLFGKSSKYQKYAQLNRSS